MAKAPVAIARLGAIGWGLACSLPAWAESQQQPQMLPTGDFSSSFVEMIFSLGLVLALMLGILWAVRRFMPSAVGAGGGSMRLISRLSLGPRRFVALVEVAGEVLVLGVAGDGIRLLYKVEDPEALRQIRKSPEPAFKNLFNKKRFKDEEQS